MGISTGNDTLQPGSDEPDLFHVPSLPLWQETRVTRTSPRMFEFMKTLDSLIVGGGAAGLQAALMLARATRTIALVDSAAPRNRFAEAMHAIAGLEGTPPLDFQATGKKQLHAYKVPIINGSVTDVADNDSTLSVTLADGLRIEARTLMVATDITDELPDIPGLAENWGNTVLHCPYCHGYEMAGQRLGVLGFAEASMHQAKLVRQWSPNVTYFTSNTSLSKENRAELTRRGFEIVDSPVTGFHNGEVQLGDASTISVDALFTGGTPRPHDEFLRFFELERHDLPFGMGTDITKGDATGATSHPRIWTAGNVVAPTANVPIAIGAGSTVGAAVNEFLVEDDWN